MGCTSCSNNDGTGTPSGCKSNGHCASGGCNKLNTYDWLSKNDIVDVDNYKYVEVSFKNGNRKAFLINPASSRSITGDYVVVEADTGYDVGSITLSGDLVRLQMKKKKARESSITKKVIRKANDRDMEKLSEARARENKTMIRARELARTLDLNMKIGEVEFQGDNRKAIFYYIAEGRVDFRELIRHYAREFKIKVEMRQIGARQESALIGGLGSCGRELCCSTWLTDFKTVSTTAARYQNLAINQAKLSGQCGRLKCCLNFELDTYMEAIEEFPKRADNLFTERGKAVLVKTDIFKGLMYYTYIENGVRGKFYALGLKRVKDILAMNKKKEKPTDLMSLEDYMAEEAAGDEHDYESVNEVIELPAEVRKKKRNNRRKKPQGGQNRRSNKGNSKGGNNKSDVTRKDQSTNKNNKPTANSNNPQNKQGGGAPKKKKFFKKKPKQGPNPKKD
jgi:cell fate regulator YaaT (PSP1 superfamily)